MPELVDIYDGMHALNIGGTSASRLWYQFRSGRMEFSLQRDRSVVLTGKHAFCCSIDERPYYLIKAFLVSAGGTYLATCGQQNDWIVWNITDGRAIGRMNGKDFYAPFANGALIISGAFARVTVSLPNKEPVTLFECLLAD